MIPPAARAGDAVGCDTCDCGVIADGCPTVFIEGSPSARVGDRTHEKDFAIKEGSATVFIGGRPAARAGDASTCKGVVREHAQRTFIGGPQTSDDASDDAKPASEGGSPSLPSAVGAQLTHASGPGALAAIAEAIIGNVRTTVQAQEE